MENLRIDLGGERESLASLVGSRKDLKRENNPCPAPERMRIGDRRKSNISYRIRSEKPEPFVNYLLYYGVETVRKLMFGSPLSLIGLDLVKSSESTPDQSISTICL